MNKRTVIIQARNGSSRFPNKMISDIDSQGTSVFEFLIKRLKGGFQNDEIYLATTVLERDNSLCEIAKKNDILYFRGNENDVLDRFIKCAEKYKINEIIRICADNPFLCMEDLNCLKTLPLQNKDYISFDIKGSPSIKTHYGFWAELVTLEALKKVQSLTDEKLYREHVTNYIYENSDIFQVKFIETIIKNEILEQNFRLTLDTPEDFKTIKFVINELGKKPQDIRVEDVYNTIKNNKEIINNMLIQIEKNSKQ